MNDNLYIAASVIFLIKTIMNYQMTLRSLHIYEKKIKRQYKSLLQQALGEFVGTSRGPDHNVSQRSPHLSDLRPPCTTNPLGGRVPPAVPSSLRRTHPAPDPLSASAASGRPRWRAAAPALGAIRPLLPPPRRHRRRRSVGPASGRPGRDKDGGESRRPSSAHTAQCTDPHCRVRR